MRRRHTRHSHPCAHDGCTTPVACSGELRRNHDGVPEVVCDDYHLDVGEVATVFCWRHSRRCELHGPLIGVRYCPECASNGRPWTDKQADNAEAK